MRNCAAWPPTNWPGRLPVKPFKPPRSCTRPGCAWPAGATAGALARRPFGPKRSCHLSVGAILAVVLARAHHIAVIAQPDHRAALEPPDPRGAEDALSRAARRLPRKEPRVRRGIAQRVHQRHEGPDLLHRRRRPVRPARNGTALGEDGRRRRPREWLQDQPVRPLAPHPHREPIQPFCALPVSGQDP